MPTCNCKNPPGGGTECPDGHAALCEVVNNSCKGVCIPVPPQVLRGSELELHAWLFTSLLERTVTPSEIKSSPELTEAIRRGAFFNKASGALVRFALPTRK